jgi:hypothetical protein
VGKPLQYGTTDEFLKFFGLNGLDDLPKMSEIEELLRTAEPDDDSQLSFEANVFDDPTAQKLNVADGTFDPKSREERDDDEEDEELERFEAGSEEASAPERIAVVEETDDNLMDENDADDDDEFDDEFDNGVDGLSDFEPDADGDENVADDTEMSDDDDPLRAAGDDSENDLEEDSVSVSETSAADRLTEHTEQSQ